jgi:hypothetical protein
MLNSKTGLAIFVMISILGAGAAASAQEAAKTKPGGKQASIGDNELKPFVKAYVVNQRLRLLYEPALMNAEDAEEVWQIQNEASAELQKSLARENLSVPEYDRIFILVNGDERLRDKVLKLVYEERKKSQ